MVYGLASLDSLGDGYKADSVCRPKVGLLLRVRHGIAEVLVVFHQVLHFLSATEKRQEKGIKNTSIRAWPSVHHLTFSPATTKEKDSNV